MRLKALLLGTGSLLLLEGLSYVAFAVVFHEGFGYSKTAALRQQRIAEAEQVHPQPANVDPTPLVPHPFLGFVYNPRYDPKGMLALHTVPVSDWGFLDDKPPFRAASAEEEVVGIFGGSVAFWFSVWGNDAMVRELEKAPALHGKRIVIVRTALGGFKQPQQLMTLNYLLALGSHFDVVVNLDGLNDIALAPGWQVPKDIFPFYPRGWADLLGEAGDPELTRLQGRVLYLEELAGERASQFSGPLLRRSVFASTVWRFLDRTLETQLAQARVEMEAYKPKAPAESRNYAFLGPTRKYGEPAEMYRDLVAVWQRSSLLMSQLARANGARYVHFLQPNQYLEGSKPMSAAERQTALWPGSSYERDVRAGYPLMQQAGRELKAKGVDFVDLTGLFSEVSEPLYTDSCCHFSREGNQLLGEAMGRAIAQALATKGRAPAH
jgi:hypothetical protein